MGRNLQQEMKTIQRLSGVGKSVSEEKGERMILDRQLTLARGLLVLVLILILTGCVAARLHRPQNVEQDDGYTLAFIEFDDQGEPWAPSQLERTIRLIENANRDGKRCVVMLFVHGWHNDASKREDRKRENNVEGFKRLLDQTQKLLHRQGHAPDEVSLIGVYLGWRGRSTDVGFLKPFTFYSRREAGQRVAGVSTTEAIQRVMAAAKQNPRSAGIVIGHSFGGMIVERALMQSLIGHTIDRGEEIVPLADLVILVNPASQAIDAKNMLSILKRNRLKYYREDQQGERSEAPFIVSITSTGDSATGSLYPTALGIKGWTKKFRQYGPTDCCPIPSQKVFYKQTAGHTLALHSHVLTTGKPIEPGSMDDTTINLQESIDPDTGETHYSFPGEEYMFTIKRLPWGYNNTPYWIMSVPPELIAGHSDIFTYNSLQMIRALCRMSGVTFKGEKSVLVRENGVQPLEVVALPEVGIAFLDLSRRIYALGPRSQRPISLSCLPSGIQPESIIGIFYEGTRGYVVASAEDKKGKKSEIHTEVIGFDLGLAGSESIQWTEIRADVVFTAAAGDVKQRNVYLANAGALYVADQTRKKPEASLLSQFSDTIELDKMRLDGASNRIFGIDRDNEGLYVIDLNAEPPVPVLIAEDLGLISDLDVCEGRPILLVDSRGKRIIEIDCSQEASCSPPELFASIPESQRPTTLARASDDTIWVGDFDARKIFVLDPDGKVTRVLDSFAGFSE